MIPNTIIHLLSGGLDSVTMMYDLADRGHILHALTFDYNQQHKKEIEFAKQHAARRGIKHSIKSIPYLGGLTDKNWIVPNRNAIFINIAVNIAIQAGADTITIGCNSEDAEYFPDCRSDFINAINASIKSAGCDIEVCAPYINKSKAWIGTLAQQIGITPNAIWSCYRGSDSPCGHCPACKKLNDAFK